MTNKKIGIFISTHKPTRVIKDDIFMPIQVGVELSKKNQIEDFLKDNVGDNISNLNPRFCELTAQYWAWKNLDLDYYGFCHYRRYFAFNTKFRDKIDKYGNIVEKNINRKTALKYDIDSDIMSKEISSCDIILPDQKDIKKMPRMGACIYDQYKRAKDLNIFDLDIMINVVKEKYPSFVPYMNEYLSGSKTYLNNMFIMRKDIFRNYNEWLFDILFECDKRIDYSNYSTEGLRTPGHLAERLLNIYILYLKDNFNYRIKEFPTVYFLDTEPIPFIKPLNNNKKNVAIALASNDYYVPYLATVIKSICSNSSPKRMYDIVVMQTDISQKNKTKLNNLIKSNGNFSIRFYDMSPYDKAFKKLFKRGHFTVETWFRLLMPEIMQGYDKIVYLDSDLVVESDIAELYDTEVENFLLAACHDADTAGLYNGASYHKKDYLDKTLKLKKPYDYFQAGIILFNLKKIRETYTSGEMLTYASSRKFELLDQDVLNYLAQGQVKYLDMSWNVLFDWKHERIKNIISKAPQELYDAYLCARKNPKIIHYAGPEKPWMDKDSDFSENFWKYADESSYKTEINRRMTDYLTEKERLDSKFSLRKIVFDTIKRIFPSNGRVGIFIRKIHSKIRKI